MRHMPAGAFSSLVYYRREHPPHYRRHLTPWGLRRMVPQCLVDRTSYTLYVSPTRLKLPFQATYDYHRLIMIMCTTASPRSLQIVMKTAPTGQEPPKRPKSHFSTMRFRNTNAHSQPNFVDGCPWHQSSERSPCASYPTVQAVGLVAYAIKRTPFGKIQFSRRFHPP